MTIPYLPAATTLAHELWWCYPNWGSEAMRIHSDADYYYRGMGVETMFI